MVKRDYHYELPDKSKYRKPTPEEIKEAEDAEKERIKIKQEIADLVKKLRDLENHPSKLFYDMEGFPFDIRHYVASGKTELI